MVEDQDDIYDDELLFYRYPQYAIYYGSNGVEYLRKVLPKAFNPSREIVKMLHFAPGDK
jgi:hypothetical protein